MTNLDRHRLRGGLSVVVVAIAASVGTSLCTAAVPEGGADVWAVGYSVHVVRTCPGWTMERQDVLSARGILPRRDVGSTKWRDGGALHDQYYRGMSAAEADQARDANFCVTLARSDPRRWRRLSRVLTRASPA